MAIEYLTADASMQERKDRARQALARTVAANIDTTIHQNMSAHKQVEQLGKNATWDYYIIPPHTVLEKEPYLKPSLKRGPFLEYKTDKDLRTLQPKIAALDLPTTGILEERVELPAQTVGVRFALKRHAYYSALLTDLLGSQLTYEALRRNAKVKERAEGNLVVDYGDGIQLTIHGLRRDKSGTINARLEGFPSRSDENILHPSQYMLEVLHNTPPKGIFEVKSGYSQHLTRNRVVWTHYRGHLMIYKPDKMLEGAVERQALSLGDLVGLRMIDAIARKQYGVEVNQPIPKFNPALIDFAQHVGNSAIIVQPNGKRKKPNTTDWNMLLGMLLASSARKELLGK